MEFALTEEQRLLAETARRFLEDKMPSERVRELMESDEGYDADLWKEIGVLGWQAMAIPEDYGGAGYSAIEQSVLLEEMGRALLPAPYLSSAVLVANVMLAAGTVEQKQAIIPAVATGDETAALAFTEPDGHWDAEGIAMPAKRDGDEFVLSGSKMFVVDGHTADRLVVAARTDDGGDAESGVSLFLVDPGAEGIERRRLETMDMTRKQAEITFDDVRVPAASLVGEEGHGWPVMRKVLQQTVVALAAEQVGGAQKCLDMSVEYAKTRMQFGRPIGSFQAIKHKCAEMLVQVESARSAAQYAAWVVAEDDEELDEVAHIAKSYCSEAYFFCASENIQIHGGIGFTWEHDAHLYFKRAKSSELLFGDPVYHRKLLADAIGI